MHNADVGKVNCFLLRRGDAPVPALNLLLSCSAFELHSQNLIKFLWGGPKSPHKKYNLDVEQLTRAELAIAPSRCHDYN